MRDMFRIAMGVGAFLTLTLNPAFAEGTIPGRYSANKGGAKTSAIFTSDGNYRFDFAPVVMYGRVVRAGSYSAGKYKAEGSVISIINEVDGVIKCTYTVEKSLLKLENCPIEVVFFRE